VEIVQGPTLADERTYDKAGFAGHDVSHYLGFAIRKNFKSYLLLELQRVEAVRYLKELGFSKDEIFNLIHQQGDTSSFLGLDNDLDRKLWRLNINAKLRAQSSDPQIFETAHRRIMAELQNKDIE